MNPSQQRAIDYFRGFMQQQLDTNPERGDEVSKFEIATSVYGSISISAATDMTKLGEGNLLRAVAHQFWLVFIGKRGSIVVRMAPKEFKQFNGRRAFGMNFDIA